MYKTIRPCACSTSLHLSFESFIFGYVSCHPICFCEIIMVVILIISPPTTVIGSPTSVMMIAIKIRVIPIVVVVVSILFNAGRAQKILTVRLMRMFMAYGLATFEAIMNPRIFALMFKQKPRSFGTRS